MTADIGRPDGGPAPWLAARALAGACHVMVFDLDGVIRRFDDLRLAERLAEVGIDHAQFAALAFGEHVDLVVTGRITFAQWGERIAGDLVALGYTRAAVDAAISRWVADRGEPIPQTVALIAELRAAGTPCFIFTNGTDTIPAELDQLGLSDVADGLINSAALRAAKPTIEAFAAAHRVIEQHLRRDIDMGQVGFVDDRIDNVVAARAFGWQAAHAV